MPNDSLFKVMNAGHRAILKVSGGRFGWNAGNMPVLELTTIGRKSGQPRKVMLTSPKQTDDSIVVVASRGGDTNHPAWFVNLRDNPSVEVRFKGGSPEKRVARIASADERSALWPEIVAAYKNYGQYQEKTDREIPVVLLEPDSSSW